MNKRFIASLVLFLTITLWMFSCSKINDDQNISSHSEDDSHYTGTNCMNCHYQSGAGEGSFTIAGSVFGNYNQHTVRAYNTETQELLSSIQIDRLGNLYTTESVDFSNGITIDIINEQGNVVAAMGTSIKTGQCNLCHDNNFQDLIIIQ